MSFRTFRGRPLVSMGRTVDRLEHANIAWPCLLCGPQTKGDFSRAQLKKGRGNGICALCSTREAPAAAAERQLPEPSQPPARRAKSVAAAAAIAYSFEPLPHNSWHNLLDLRTDSIRQQPPTPASHASAALEAERLRAVRDLAGSFWQHCGVLGEAKWYQYYENWLWACRGAQAAEDESVVPVIPRLPSPHGGGDDGATSPASPSPAQTELARRLEHKGLSAAAARTACDALADKAAALCAHLDALSAADCDSAKGEESSKRLPERGAKGKRKRTDGQEASQAVVATREAADPSSVHLSCGDVSVPVRETILHKLWALYASVHASVHASVQAAAVDAETTACFLEAAFCVLARCLALQGGHIAAGGMQLACPRAVFDTLRADLGVSSELFASPLNCRYARFCSASVDVDARFGSHGSFFRYTPTSGAFLANPPFDPLMVIAMARRMERLLAAADAAQLNLTFVITMPHWQMPRGPHLPAWQALRNSAHNTFACVLAKGKHLYVDQQGRSSPSRHETSVMLLQSREAARRVPFTEAMQMRLCKAFAMRDAEDVLMKLC